MASSNRWVQGQLPETDLQWRVGAESGGVDACLGEHGHRRSAWSSPKPRRGRIRYGCIGLLMLCACAVASARLSLAQSEFSLKTSVAVVDAQLQGKFALGVSLEDGVAADFDVWLRAGDSLQGTLQLEFVRDAVKLASTIGFADDGVEEFTLIGSWTALSETQFSSQMVVAPSGIQVLALNGKGTPAGFNLDVRSQWLPGQPLRLTTKASRSFERLSVSLTGLQLLSQTPSLDMSASSRSLPAFVSGQFGVNAVGWQKAAIGLHWAQPPYTGMAQLVVADGQAPIGNFTGEYDDDALALEVSTVLSSAGVQRGFLEFQHQGHGVRVKGKLSLSGTSFTKGQVEFQLAPTGFSQLSLKFLLNRKGFQTATGVLQASWSDAGSFRLTVSGRPDGLSSWGVTVGWTWPSWNVSTNMAFGRSGWPRLEVVVGGVWRLE